MSITRFYGAGFWPAVTAILLLPLLLTAQDPSFSQFYANRIYLNPAFTGIEGGIALSGSVRVQWVKVDKGFRTYDFAVETRLPHIGLGLGLHLLKNTEGLSNLSTTQAGLAVSYTIPGQKNNVHFGMETRLVQKSIDWDKLVFSDQIDPVYGVVYPSSVVPVFDKIIYGDFDFGVVWRHEGSLKSSGKSIRKVKSSLGVSFHHLPYLISRSAKGNDSFLNSESRIAPRSTLHGGLIIPITFLRGSGKEISLSPNFKLDMQGYKFLSIKENLTVSTFGLYTLVDNFYLGILYQNRFWLPNGFHTDAMIFTMGAYTNPANRPKSNVPSLFFGLSVDFNATGVGPAAGSVFELTFRYRFDTELNIGGRLRGNRSSKHLLD